MHDNIDEPSRLSVLDHKLLEQEIAVNSENLPRNVSMQLYDLMKQVVKNDVTPATVKAACLCATEIHRMLKLNQEIRKS